MHGRKFGSNVTRIDCNDGGHGIAGYWLLATGYWLLATGYWKEHDKEFVGLRQTKKAGNYPAFLSHLTQAHMPQALKPFLLTLTHLANLVSSAERWLLLSKKLCRCRNVFFFHAGDDARH